MLHENLKKIRAALGCSQQEMADKLNVNVNTYRGWEYNKREIPIFILQQLIYSLRININWFLTAEGGMFQQEEGEQNHSAFQNKGYEKDEEILSTDEIRFLKNFVKYCRMS